MIFRFWGILSLLWLLIRVIPKPSRLNYPCMKVAAPMATTFLTLVLGIFTSVFAFKKAHRQMAQSRCFYAVLFFVFAVTIAGFTFLTDSIRIFADDISIYSFQDPLGANSPIGEAKGIFPGRVVWVHDPGSTNESCQSTKWKDGYFLDKNCSQPVVDDMFSKALLALTGKETDAAAWDAIFKYFNHIHGKGDTGFQTDEKIFIKINSVHASNMDNKGNIRSGGDYGRVDTSPQAVHALLKQLVNQAGVPQQNIYVGDPYRPIFNHCYEKWAADLPGINYMSSIALEGRKTLTKRPEKMVIYSDKKTVLDIEYDRTFNCVLDAEYVINVPAMKGHRWGGVTFFAKNHFGTNTRGDASHLHKGLHRTGYDAPLRTGYRKYRVMVDLMGADDLGGKTLLYYMDGLRSTSYELDPPVKFQIPPFNSDWSSSVFLSLYPVAISSVCLDILQAEFTEEDGSNTDEEHGERCRCAKAA
ncbi:DUF362 domain-containing protein [candidate division KSB1 bacterium]|nr:DUF362 domain-containing protein [candidate division KSB1 bacterium]